MNDHLDLAHTRAGRSDPSRQLTGLLRWLGGAHDSGEIKRMAHQLVATARANPEPSRLLRRIMDVHLDLERRLTSTDIVSGDSAEPVKRTRKRKPTLAGVARQAAKAGFPVAGYEVRPDGTIKIITGKPVGGGEIEMDDTASPDRSEWN